MNRGDEKRERRTKAIEAAALDTTTRQERHARQIEKGRACTGCKKCLCQKDHDGKKCGKKLTSKRCSMEDIVVAQIDPHIVLEVDDNPSLIEERLRLDRPLTVEESNRVLTGAEA